MKRRSYQQGSVVAVKKNGKIVAWDFRWREHGQNKSVRLGSIENFPLKAKAEKAAEPLRLGINDNRECVRFHQLAARYEAEELPERMSTRAGYRSNLRRVREKWDSVRLDEMANDPVSIEMWMTDLKTLAGHGAIRPLKRKSKQNLKNLLHQLFDRAMAWQYLSLRRNPIELVRIKEPKGFKSKKKARELISPKQFELMLKDKTLPVYVRVMIAIAMCTGIRISEILGLRWEHVDFEGQMISIEVSAVGKYQDAPKTESSEEVVPLHDDLVVILRAWQKQVPSINGWVFGNPVTGRPYWRDSMQEYLLKVGAELAIEDLGWHTFRHTYRRMLDDLGAPLEVQQHLMRHSSIAMTERYGKKKGAKLGITRPANERLVRALPMPEELPMLEAHISTSKTGFFGVYPQANKFAAKISVKSKKEYIGFFDTAEEAAKAYDKKAFELKGINAALNFPEDYAARTVTNNEISTEEAGRLEELVLN